MYIPSKYRADDWELQEALIKNYPLGTVVTSHEGKLIANHIPFFLKIGDDGKKYLHAHIARVNHQIPSLKESDEVLVIFQLADSYISPSYYANKPVTHKFVPTWDFASLHVYGKSKIVDDKDFVRAQLDNFTRQNEEKRDEPWEVSEAPEKYVNTLIKAITGLEIEIDRVECKYKFEQEMKPEDKEGVINGLAEDEVHEVSKLVKDTNSRGKGCPVSARS